MIKSRYNIDLDFKILVAMRGIIWALGILVFILVPAACNGQSSTRITPLSTVDWYRPPPATYRGVEAEISIPTELIAGVYPNRGLEAAALLGNANIIEITEEKVMISLR